MLRYLQVVWLLRVATQQPRYNGLLHQTQGRPLSAGMHLQPERQAKIPARPQKQNMMVKDAQYDSLCYSLAKMLTIQINAFCFRPRGFKTFLQLSKRILIQKVS